MAIFCSKECEETGAVCDFCCHFAPEIEYNGDAIIPLNEGTCLATGDNVERSDGFRCEYFVCFRTDEKILREKEKALEQMKIKKGLKQGE